MTTRIQLRQDASTEWTSVNPILSLGELGHETDTSSLKIGDGITAWASLPYLIAGSNTTKSYTPTLAQGASTNISKTVNRSRYFKNGGWVNGSVKVSATAAGTSGSAITITLPVATGASNVGLVAGSGFYNDGGTQYQAVVYIASTTTIGLLSTHGTASTSTDDPIGVNPNIAVASGDIFNVSFSYEAG